MKSIIITLVSFSTILTMSLISCVEFKDNLPETVSGNKKSATRAMAESPYFYYYGEEKQYLELNTESVFVAISNEANAELLISKSAKNASMNIEPVKRDKDGSSWTTMNFGNKLSKDEYLLKLSEIQKTDNGIIASPYFKSRHKDKFGLSTSFAVELKKAGDIDILKREAEKVYAVIDHQNEFMPLWYTLKLTERSEYNALELANRFHESGLFQNSVPDFIDTGEPLATNDPYFSGQWGLQNPNQSGMSVAGINAEQAWNLSTGEGVVVAVVDDGVWLDHPDLEANIHSSFCPWAPGPQVTRPTNSRHATPVAGIVGTIKDNGIGIVGVAPDCKIMSAQITHSNQQEYIADGINWAWQNGADILNCSWQTTPDIRITQAIQLALMAGRAGKGCVVVCAAGNKKNDTTIIYPANADPDIVVVGAVASTGKLTEALPFRQYAPRWAKGRGRGMTRRGGFILGMPTIYYWHTSRISIPRT
jgi:subtilisin family serine protease